MIKANAPLEAKIEKLLLPPNSRSPAYLQYALTKLANVLFALKLHRELHGKGVSSYVLHPGSMIPTNIGRNYGVFNKLSAMLFKPFTKTLDQGAATTVSLVYFTAIFNWWTYRFIVLQLQILKRFVNLYVSIINIILTKTLGKWPLLWELLRWPKKSSTKLGLRRKLTRCLLE